MFSMKNDFNKCNIGLRVFLMREINEKNERDRGLMEGLVIRCLFNCLISEKNYW